jgi:hypothetical protein
VGRFLSVDPITKEYPMLTPYQFAGNRPIDGIDQDGMEFMKYLMPSSRGTGLGINMAWLCNAIGKTKYNQAHGIPDPGSMYHYQQQIRLVAISSITASATIFGGVYGNSNFWALYPQLVYNPIVHTEIIGGLAALTGYNGPDIPSPGQTVESAITRKWEEWAITTTKGGKDVIKQELKATATLIMQSGSKFENEAEKAIAQKLLSEGKTVEVLAESKILGVKTADFKIDGVLTEFKDISGVKNVTSDKLSKFIKDRLGEASGQAKQVILNFTNQEGATLEIARRGVARYFGTSGGNTQNVRIIGKGFDEVLTNTKAGK